MPSKSPGKFEKGSPAAARMAKYMVQVSSYVNLDGFVQAINSDVAAMPDWQQELINYTRTSLHDSIDEHFKKSSTTRQKFASMPEEQWKDADGHFILNEEPRPVIGYLEKKHVALMDKIVLDSFTASVMGDRERIHSALDACRSSQAERESVEELLARETFYLADVVEHRSTADEWDNLKELKLAVLAKLREREEFLEEVDHFETMSTGDKDRHTAKGANSIKLNEENKFRAYAAKHLKALNEDAIKSCINYAEETGSVLEVDGVDYLLIIKEQNFGRPENGNFSLARLPIDKISVAANKKYSGLKHSGLIAVKDEDLKTSTYEKGIDSNKVVTLDCITEELRNAIIG